MKTKLIFKRALTLLLALLTLLSASSLGLSAAQVELANIGYDISAGSKVYYLDTASWNACQMYLWKDSDGYNTYYTLSKITNTKIYYYNFGSAWNGYSGFKFRSNTSWSKQTNGDIKRSITANTYFYGTSTTASTTMANMNGTAKVVTMISTNGGTSYTATADANTYTTLSGFNLGSGATSTTTKTANTKTSSSVTFEAAYGSTITYTANPASNATFKGFSTTNSSTLPSMSSTSTTYTRTATAYGTSDNTTVYAYYIVDSNVTATFVDHDNTPLGTSTVASNTKPTPPADPTREGYTFTGWSDGTNTYTSDKLPAITANTTFKAQYDINEYTVTAKADPSAGGTVEQTASTVEHGGSVTFTAKPNEAQEYVFKGWTVDGMAFSGNTTSTTLQIDNITNDITVTASFKQTPTYTINAAVANNTGGSVNLTQEHKIGQGDSFEFKATPAVGYRFSHWTINGTYEEVDGTVNSATFKITPKENLTATAHFVKVWTVTFVDMNGSKLAEISVDNGSTVPTASVPTPPTVEHYTFTGWDTDYSNVTEDLTVKAQYTGKTYTVTVNTAANGTVQTTATSVVYPGKVTLTATPDAGYTLVNWGISGLSEEDSKDTNTITIIPKSNLTITPNFALGRKLTVYTYSANGYNTLTLTEDGSNNVINGVDQPLTQEFNGVTWDKSNQTDISVNATELTAELSGTSSGSATDSNTWYADGNYLVADGYRTIVFKNNWCWTDVCLYAWNSDNTPLKAWPGDAMKKVSGTDSNGDAIYVMLVPEEYINFKISGIKNDNSGARDESPNKTLPSDSIKSYQMNWNNANQLVDAGLSMQTYTAFGSSGSISLNEQLFDGTTWLGREEVWVYQNGTTSKVTYRRDLLDLITQHTKLVDTDNADEGYTSDSWANYVAAYNAAVTESGKADADQTAIDNAKKALEAAYGALVPQTSVTVTYTQNFAPSSAHIGSTTINAETGTVKVVQGKEVEVKFVAPYCYYISAVKINGELVEITGPDAWTYLASRTFTADTTIEVVYEQNPELIVKENGATGGTVVFGSNITNYEGKNLISYGYNSSFDVTAPNLYYIQSIYVDGQKVYEGTDETKVSIPNCPLNNVTEDVNIVITYAKRSTLKIEILSYPTIGGTLYYGDTAIPAEGTVIEVLAGESVTITAKPNTGYGVYYWIVDSASGDRELSYTFSDIKTNHTLDIEWKELTQINVTVMANPHSAGTSTAVTGSSQAVSNGTSTITVQEDSVVTLTAVATDKCYEFLNWTIEGSFYEKSGDRTSSTYVIVPSTSVTATANFVKTKRAVYLVDVAGWNTCYAYTWTTGHDGEIPWPGVKMEYAYTNDAGKKVYVAYVDNEDDNIQFNDGKDGGKKTGDLAFPANMNTYNNSTGIWSPYVVDGYYLFGNWNGKNHTAYDYYQFYLNADGTYSVEIIVDSTTDGYIYVNPGDEESHLWESVLANQTDNPQTLTGPTSEYLEPANRNAVKVKIDTDNLTKSYKVKFTFDPETGEFSWKVVENVPTIIVVATDGSNRNQEDKNMSGTNNRVGATSFDANTVNSLSSSTTYVTAQVLSGSPVTFYTQVNKNTVTNAYDYYVAGWVINGTEFVSATALGNGKYSGSYIFTEDESTVVPVYFHTKEWLAANSVKTVTVYAVADKDIENWDKYFAAYTWYKDSTGTTVYEQFGVYTGQLMIPVTGLNGVYYTYIETSTSSGVQVSGITFSNYAPADKFDTKPVVSYTNIQTYDYYEFVSLLNDGKHNITFVIKDTNDTYNSDKVAVNENETLSQFDFVQYTDYSGLKTDIFGTNIEDKDSSLSDSNALYIIQAGDKNVSNDTIKGQWYVECYLYDATGKYLGKCYSYELHDKDSAIWSTLEPYKNQRAYISYEHVNDARYDGEWYGDANVSVTINLAVKVALMDKDGKYTIDTEGDINKAIYGEAFINNLQNVDVTRGETVSLSGMPLTGYKFVGWYTADGKLFDTNLASKVTAAIGTYYVAVFEPLASDSFYVNHYIYTGNTTSSYNPPVHGGNAQLYVGIQNVTRGTTTSLLLGNSANLVAYEGDKLIITIATDGIGADKFYSWYTDAVDKFGNATFEEVGVDSFDNLYNNNGTVVGRSDRVYFQFEYIVGSEIFSLNLYSDLMPVSVDRKLVYQYTDRYGNPKSYTVLYTLTPEEIEGFEGNEFTPYTPAYISSPDKLWVNTVLEYAPYVEDYFADTTWKINSSMYDTMTFLLWATQPETLYTVTTTVITDNGADVIVKQVPYNTVIDLDIRDLVPDASYTGFWYQDINNNGSYEKTVDIILTYGPYYGYRVTQNMSINYQKVDSQDDYKFNVSLDAPVYGREQTTDNEGNNKTDIVIIDYVINILTPYFYYNHPEFTPIYNDKEYSVDEWGRTLVTIESLIDAGYDVSYGVLLQQVGTFKIKENYNNKFEDAEAAAKLKGYGTATDDATLIDFLNTGATKGFIGDTNTYGYVYDASEHNITNKNRVLFVLEQNNTESNQNRFYNVYGYLTVTYNGVTTTYISNVQTLNIYVDGNKDAVVENNTSFA